MPAPAPDELRVRLDRLHDRGLHPRRMLHPLAALDDAIRRLRELVAEGNRGGEQRRELLQVAAHDVLRAIVHARRWTRELEREGLAALDVAAAAIGADIQTRLGYTRRVE